MNKIESIRQNHPVGIRIKIIHMQDIQAPPRGTIGTVTHVDDAGSIHMNWETGSSLAIIPGIDEYRIIKDETYKRLRRCQDCAALSQASRTFEMFCDEYGDFCKNVEKCPEGLEV